MNKIICTMLLFIISKTIFAFPSICATVNTSSFDKCMALKTKIVLCGFPPHPCAQFSYYIPDYFIEIVSNPGESFFSSLPGTAIQLNLLTNKLPFGSINDTGGYSFHAHTINVPFGSLALTGLPCAGPASDRFCFSSMSEHLGSLWNTGEGDRWQPAYLAWSLSPKACLIKGAITSSTGESRPTIYPNLNICSFSRSFLKRFPPSTLPVCNGWGINFPRYGTVTSSDSTTASLTIAARMKSLGAEVFQSISGTGNEKWQMITPQSSSCFREGQNIGLLRLKKVSEWGRLANGKLKNYLYVIWKPVTCVKEIPQIATTYAWIAGLKISCKGIK